MLAFASRFLTGCTLIHLLFWGILWEPLLEKLEVMPENSYVDKKFWLSKSFTGMIYLPSIAPHFMMSFHILQYF